VSVLIREGGVEKKLTSQGEHGHWSFDIDLNIASG